MPTDSPALIPNINLGRDFDRRYEGADIHYEALARLADFFGRNMGAHRHDRVFQVHFLETGEVRLQLEDQFYQASAPLFFVTPPSIPHAFVFSDDAQGHVLTVHQAIVWALASEGFAGEPGRALTEARCVALPPSCVASERPASELARAASGFDAVPRGSVTRTLIDLFHMLRDEASAQRPERGQSLHALTRLIFIWLHRASDAPLPKRAQSGRDLTVFRAFNELVEHHYAEHWPLARYAEALNVTESRLNDICRRLADVPSKRVPTDRLMQEAKRLLRFTRASVSEIAWQLGYRDDAYFCRVFRREIGAAPAAWRRRLAPNNDGDDRPPTLDQRPMQE
ncbi:4-hydroxyphenylacetate catabolism regulatory protein HpaA [Chitinasiproducens palmae]|uniref:Transcriptional regulator, AraC family n=1 Tax=Chitinasiproducens palmae TaxID=1770053 RepID=A0A1H2PJ36_9BURK|nr:4-hydroxyphenylacetate catabolism regulatory protein HpaA [Chitinasiproducens palmae]SDV46362.1 transcriptional regulator, AraC family [Chitinasiproducens palmae]